MYDGRVTESGSETGADAPRTSTVVDSRSAHGSIGVLQHGDGATRARPGPHPEPAAATLLERGVQVSVAPLIMAATTAFAFVLLVFRNIGQIPWVMEDERLYSQSARLVPLSAANIPNYLYYAVYGYSDQCGDGFLDCARVLNSVFFVLAAPIIYVVARRVCSPLVALIISAATVLGPASTYTAYFTPEAMYFFGFWVLTWAVLRVPGPTPRRSWIVIGVILGLLSLVKVHALFLLPGLGLYLALLSRRHQRDGWISRAALTVLAMAAATVLTKLTLGFMVAGDKGLSLSGTSYAAFVPGNGLGGFATLAGQVITALEGHFVALAGLFALPLVILVAEMVRGTKHGGSSTESQRISTYTLSLLVSVVFAVSLVTAQIHQYNRLHLRYYDFLLPLLLIVVGAQVPRVANSPITSLIRARLGLAMIILMVSAGAIATVAIASPIVDRATYFASLFDAPWLYAWSQGSPIAYLVVAASLLMVAVARWDVAAASRVYLVVLIPVLAVVTSAVAYQGPPHADVYATAGRTAHDLLTPDERARLVVVGPYAGPLHTALLYVDAPGARLLAVPDAVDESQLPAAAVPDPFTPTFSAPEFALLVGVRWAGADVPFEVSGPGFSLIRLPGARTVDFTRASWLGLVSNTQGLSSPEGSGTWSDGKTVRISFVSRLPNSFVLHLRGGAFGPNLGAPIWIQVGQERKSFTLGPGPEDVDIPFVNTGSPSEISIEIPYPASPKELGMGPDTRELGIWLAEMRVNDSPSD